MAWDISPPASGTKDTNYSGLLHDILEAQRERNALVGTCNFEWPYANRVWAEGRITGIADNGDNTLTITCQVQDGTGTWVDAFWVDGSSIKRWTNFSGTFDTHTLFDDVPSDYKVVVFKADTPAGSGSRTIPNDPKYGHTLAITDNGVTTLKVNDDGLLTLNFGRALADFSTGYRFQIIRRGASAPERYGYSWLMRYPPYPNSAQYGYGFVAQTKKLTLAGTNFTITVDGQTTTPPLLPTSTATDIEAAIAALSSVAVGDIDVEGTGPFYLIFGAANAASTVTASGASLADALDRIGDLDDDYDSGQHNGRDIIFKLANGKWVRKSITGTSRHYFQFSAAPSALAYGGYYAIVAAGTFWRPFLYAGIGGREFRLELKERVTVTGSKVKFWEVGYPWVPFTWYSTLQFNFTKSHDPKADAIGDYNLPKQQATIKECASFACDCNVDAPDGGRETIDVFDVDVLTLPENYCVGEGDKLMSPYFYWGLRGLQVDQENLCASFVEAKDWTGAKAIINFVVATWFKKHKSANTRTKTITSVSGPVATFASLTMPTATPQQGAHTSLPCHYALFNPDTGLIDDFATGTVTATTLTIDSHGNPLEPKTDFIDPDDIGKTLIISFDFTRKYERRVHWLTPRTVFIPDTDMGVAVFPPNDTHPGSYEAQAASTHYAEYDKYGQLDDSGPAFINGESARYVADYWDAPTGWDEFEDLYFQGVPAHRSVSDFPRYNRKGGVSVGGIGWLQTSSLFWVTASPLRTDSGTASGGSSNTLTDASKASDPYWLSMSGQRFVGMILEVSFDAGATYEHQPITAQSGTTLTVSRNFSAVTNGKPYRIREPGAKGSQPGKGAILNWLKGKSLIVTHSGTPTTVTITHCDDHRIYWSGTTAATTGDTWEIDEPIVGAVLHRKAGAWVKPDDADADTRGHEWFTISGGMNAYGVDGRLLNCPTIVTNYGRLRKGDIITAEVWEELYSGINAMRHTLNSMVWDCNGDICCYTAGDMSTVREPSNRAGYDAAFTSMKTVKLAQWRPIADGGEGDPCGPSFSFSFPPQFATSAYADRGGTYTGNDDPFEIGMDTGTPIRVHGKTVVGTLCFYSATDFYAKALAALGSEEQFPAADACNLPPYENRQIRFDAFGSGLLYNQFKKFGTLPASIDATRFTTDAFGPDPINPALVWDQPIAPTLAAQCAASDQLNTCFRGFKVVDEQVVLKWDVSGGLKYVD